MSKMVCFRFPHGREIRWTSDVPTVGRVVTHARRCWIVLAENIEDGCPTFDLGPLEFAGDAALPPTETSGLIPR